MEESNELMQERKKKLEALREMGAEPYGGRVEGLESIVSILEPYREGRKVKIAGRLMSWRSHGKTIFADVVDAEGKIQLFLRKNEMSEEMLKLLDLLDIGDILCVEGELFKTRTEMISVKVQALRVVSKAIRPMPEKWHGLKDVETRYRQRYVDLASSPEVRKIFVARSRALTEIRRHLDGHGYLEVETPMMHPIPGGAAGRPFKTHHEALDIDLYMRIAPELYLKRLLVGGMEKVYEINKSFRNEGISTRHNPEFTMLEVYTAYADCEDVMALTEGIIRQTARAVTGSDVLTWQGAELDLSVFERVSFAQLLKDAYDISPEDETSAWVTKLQAKGVKVEGKDLSRTKLLRIIGDLIEPEKRKHPVFVTDYFTELCPLAKRRKDNPQISERFELYLGGMEVANGYSELNDPQEQLERLTSDVDEGAEGTLPGLVDRDFVRALEFGMPPAGGLGIGFDRLVMALTDQPSIREVILFPQLKPEKI